MAIYNTLRDLVESLSDTEFYKSNYEYIRFELNHLELHHIDNYLLNLYNKKVSGINNKNNSNIAYLIGITEDRPEYKITTKGGGFPDIDTDLGRKDRDKVLEYLKNKYGDGFAHIGTMTYTSGKNVWNSSARIHGLPFAKSMKVSSLIPDNPPRLEKLIEEVDEIASLYNSDSEFKEVYDDAIKLQDCVNSLGVHACYAANTLVTTNTGYKNIQDVAIGDKVLTISGLYEDVINTIITENKDTLKVSGSSFLDFEVTPDHPIYVATKNSKINSYEYGFKSIENIDISKDMLVYSINNNSIMPNIDFKNINYTSESFWELLGLFVADGWTENPRKYDYRVILCSEKDEEEKKYISNLFLESGITFRLEETRTTYKYNFHIKGNNIYDIALMFGCGAKNKEIPGFVFDLPKNYIKAFIKGYLYGDGSLRDSGYSYRTVSTKLAIGITSLIAKAYGKVGTINKNIRSNTSIIEGRTVNQSDIYSCYIRNNTRSYIIDGENILCKINSIEEGSKNISVYNLTVANNSTFVANNIITHNCGICLSDRPLYEYIPLWDNKGAVVTQYEGGDVEAIGIVKLDLLGLKYLDTLKVCKDLVLQNHGVDIDIYKLPMDNKEAYQGLWEGQNLGIFQFEGAGISAFLNGCKPKSIHDLAVITSVYRPGPMNIPGLMGRIAGKIRGDIDDGQFMFPKYTHLFKMAHNELVYQEQFKDNIS